MGTGTLTDIDSVFRIDNQSMSLCWLLTEGRRNCLPLKTSLREVVYILLQFCGVEGGGTNKEAGYIYVPCF